MKTHLKQLAVSVALFAVTALPAGAVVSSDISAAWIGNQMIPDNNASGVAFTFTIPYGGPLAITNVTVDISIAGGWNGDLYAYLSHGSGFSVLLNRIGSTSMNRGGSGVSGMNVFLADTYLTDIHTAPNNPLTGAFAPDGRRVNPFLTLDTDARTAMLGDFIGLNPAGVWTIFFADVSPLSVSTIQSWSVNIGVTAVPEPGMCAFLGLAALAFLFKRK